MLSLIGNGVLAGCLSGCINVRLQLLDRLVVRVWVFSVSCRPLQVHSNALTNVNGELDISLAVIVPIIYFRVGGQASECLVQGSVHLCSCSLEETSASAHKAASLASELHRP